MLVFKAPTVKFAAITATTGYVMLHAIKATLVRHIYVISPQEKLLLKYYFILLYKCTSLLYSSRICLQDSFKLFNAFLILSNSVST